MEFHHLNCIRINSYIHLLSYHGRPYVHGIMVDIYKCSPPCLNKTLPAFFWVPKAVVVMLKMDVLALPGTIDILASYQIQADKSDQRTTRLPKMCNMRR